MKQITRVLKAGLLPEKMINDGKVSTFAKLLFPILTLYAVPDETGEEWEFDVAECSEKWLPIGAPKIHQVLKDLEGDGYIEDLQSGNSRTAVFSFPDWVIKMLLPPSYFESPLAVYNEQKANPPDYPFAKRGKDGEEQAVHRAGPPAGYAERGCRKDRKCESCKKKIHRGEKYFQKSNSGNAPKICASCAGGTAAESVTVTVCADEKIPFEEAREVMKKVQAEFVEKREANSQEIEHAFRPRGAGIGEERVCGALPRNKTIIGFVGADLSLEIVKELHVREHVSGDAFEVIGCTREVIVNYLEALPEL